ncbi:hypothetical protein YPPY113_3209, partial [Yersinia pestis PY-113]
MNKRWGGH